MRYFKHSTRQNQKNAHEAKKHKLSATAIVVVALFCVLCLIFFMFAHSYQSLQDAIFLERIDYVEEISAQITTSRIFMEKEYSEIAANLANILEHENIYSLADIHEYVSSKDKSEILLMSQGNDIIDLGGIHYSMPNDDLVKKMINKEGVLDLFTSLNYAEDSWLFVVPISPKEIEGTVYKAVILSVSADEFRSNMTISLLDDRGASYIIGNDGSIKVKPALESLIFNGYNLFSSMIDRGATKEDIERLEENLKKGETGSTVIQAEAFDWLVGHTPIDSETSIVVAIPLTLTAAQTYEGLNTTIIFSILAVAIVALIGVVLILQFFRRDRIREKKALAVAAKSEFYSKMSHDMRTPLNAVIGLVELAQDETDNPEVKGYLTQSLSSAKYLLSIINDVLEVSRIESGKSTISANPFDMNELLREIKTVTKPLLEEKELAFNDEAKELFDIEYIGDQVRIKQILANLLSNAIKFTKPGGSVGLCVTRVSGGKEYDVVTMIVSDTGIGMSEQFLTRIFTPFEQEHSSYTQQYAGSGLGLSIVYDLVKLMNGTIEVDSQLDIGSTFTVSLPLLRGKEIAEEERPQKQMRVSFSGKRLLLAEDNKVNQMVAVKILSSKFDIETEVASDGEIAVRMFADSAPGTYDMILMDVKMPNMDGLSATRAIRALPRPDAQTIPIVALSANAYKEDIELSLSAGMDDHISKPLDIKILTVVFQSFLGSCD